jgi:hypothetical protein
MRITEKEEKEVKQFFGLSASPNPATQEFQLQIQSGNQVDKAVLIVRDASRQKNRRDQSSARTVAENRK